MANKTFEDGVLILHLLFADEDEHPWPPFHLSAFVSIHSSGSTDLHCIAYVFCIDEQKAIDILSAIALLAFWHSIFSTAYSSLFTLLGHLNIYDLSLWNRAFIATLFEFNWNPVPVSARSITPDIVRRWSHHIKHDLRIPTKGVLAVSIDWHGGMGGPGDGRD